MNFPQIDLLSLATENIMLFCYTTISSDIEKIIVFVRWDESDGKIIKPYKSKYFKIFFFDIEARLFLTLKNISKKKSRRHHLIIMCV